MIRAEFFFQTHQIPLTNLAYFSIFLFFSELGKVLGCYMPNFRSLGQSLHIDNFCKNQGVGGAPYYPFLPQSRIFNCLYTNKLYILEILKLFEFFFHISCWYLFQQRHETVLFNVYSINTQINFLYYFRAEKIWDQGFKV